MKTIIVPTDFSAAAENATNYAAQLAKHIDATVLLMHVYQMPVTMTDYPVLMVTVEDLKKTADEGLRTAKEAARKNFADVRFETESRLGDVTEEVADLCKEHDAFALVVGTKELSGFERFLFGNTTLSLIKTCPYPVIAVPEGTAAGVPQNIVLATDLLNIGEIPTEKVVEIITALQSKLHVVHVELKEEQVNSPDLLMNALKTINASYHAIKEDNVAEGIKHYVKQNNIDLVLVFPHKHNLYERIFFKGHTKGILQSMPVPVMSVR